MASIFSLRSVRAALTLTLTFAVVVLWNVTAHATDTRTETRNLPDGSTEVCKYETDFAATSDGAHVIRHAWRCVRTSKR